MVIYYYQLFSEMFLWDDDLDRTKLFCENKEHDFGIVRTRGETKYSCTGQGTYLCKNLSHRVTDHVVQVRTQT